MPARRIPGSYHRKPPEDRATLAATVRKVVQRARDRQAGITSIDTARRDRRARKAGTLDDVRAIEDRVLKLVEDRS